MDILSVILIIAGLCLFETISSIDNAIINAEVLSTMGERAKRWFLLWGILFAVFVIRGVLPWLIVWLATPSLGPVGAFFATFSSDPAVISAIEQSAPVLLMGGGVFLIFLFFHWIFLEEKHYGLRGERYIESKGVWFFAVVSVLLAAIVWFALSVNPLMAFGAVVGSTAFFIVHGFRQNAELQEKKMMGAEMSDISKLFYLEVIDATFSIDGVLGAFAFTLSVPLILIGNGLGAFVVREMTMKNISTIKKYIFLKNGAMYSILCLGTIMVLDAFGLHIPPYFSPVVTFAVVGFFLLKSVKNLKENGGKPHAS
ncbi:MAG: Integral membrane protein TerC family protein [Methanoregula sp. PtaU1.Bin051]|nr:MAG: Integral membrane protein TerC family protein [Methanoregula sp. PtaU1.Bin051]